MMKNQTPNDNLNIDSSRSEDHQCRSAVINEFSRCQRPYPENADVADDWPDDAENAHYVRGYN